MIIVESIISVLNTGLMLAMFIYFFKAVASSFGQMGGAGLVAINTASQGDINKESGQIGEFAAKMKAAYNRATKERKREQRDERHEIVTLIIIRKYLDKVAEHLLHYNQDQDINKMKDVEKLKSNLNELSQRFSKLTKFEVDEFRTEKERQENERNNSNLLNNDIIKDMKIREELMNKESSYMSNLQKILNELFKEINGYLARDGTTILTITQSLHTARDVINKLIDIIKIEKAENKKKEL